MAVPKKLAERDGRTELHYAVIDGKSDLVRLLLASGQNPSAADKSGWTPLHFAAQNQQIEITKLLIQHGAIIDAQDSYGNTPLGKAVFSSRGNGEIIKLLREAGANPQLENKTGVTPLLLAQRIGNYDVKQFFNDLIPS